MKVIDQVITGPVTLTINDFMMGQNIREYVSMQSFFTFGSGGTACKLYLQTSLDDGVTWIDVICHAYAAATLRQVSAVNSALAAAAGVNAAVAGALADNTILNGIIGFKWRLIVVVTGTFAGGTNLRVDINDKHGIR